LVPSLIYTKKIINKFLEWFGKIPVDLIF
jgi:hypothetical protein